MGFEGCRRWLAMACFVAATLPAQAVDLVAVLSPTRDATLYEDPAGAIGNGRGERFFAGHSGMSANGIRRGVIAFDVAAGLPAGAIVTGVHLTLNVVQAQAGPRLVGLHRAAADWGEGESDPLGGEGGGTFAATGDATWLHRFFDTAFWSAPGGDYAPTASATLAVELQGSYTWPSTPELAADVQSWLDDPALEFGWVLVGDETAPGTSKAFASKDHPDPTLHPTLTVEYRVDDDDEDDEDEASDEEVPW